MLIVEKLLTALESTLPDTQYIIVDDGSTDGTKEILFASNYSKDPRFTIVSCAHNQGKGSAIRAALPLVLGEFTLVQDADLEYSPNDIPKLFAYAHEHGADVVYGSRNLAPDSTRGTPLFYWGGRLITAITNIFFRQKLTDEACGYKLISTKLIRDLPLTCKRFEFCPEVTAYIAKRGVTIPEVAVSYAPRSKKEGKKINIHDGIAAIATLLRIRFSLQKTYTQAFFIFLFVFGVFFLSWNQSVSGYEPEAVSAATALIQGDYLVKKPAIGSSLLYVPFVYISKIFTPNRAAKILTLVPLFYSALAMVFVFFIVNRLGIRRSVSIVGVLLLAVGSLVWPYSKLGMTYQEMLLISLLLLTLLRWKETQTNIFLLLIGAQIGFLALAKSYGIVIALPASLFILTVLHHQGKRGDFFKLTTLWRLYLPVTLVAIYLLAVNFLIAGRFSGAYLVSNEFQIVSWWDGLWGIFFGFGKSIFVYSPLLVPSLFFWPLLHKKFPAVSVFVLTAFGLYFLITAPFSYWSDETPSVRKLVPLIPLLHLPLFLGFSSLLDRRKKILLAAFSVLAIVAVYVQLINSFYPYFRYMHIVRKGNVDSLEEMRYNPQISQVYINHRLFVSYLQRALFNSSSQYNYVERTWMRGYDNPGAKDFSLNELKIDLNRYNTPSIYFLISTSKYTHGFVIIYFVSLSWVALYLGCTSITKYKEERTRSTGNLRLNV